VDEASEGKTSRRGGRPLFEARQSDGCDRRVHSHVFFLKKMDEPYPFFPFLRGRRGDKTAFVLPALCPAWPKSNNGRPVSSIDVTSSSSPGVKRCVIICPPPERGRGAFSHYNTVNNRPSFEWNLKADLLRYSTITVIGLLICQRPAIN
jgi:hypothetical protein